MAGDRLIACARRVLDELRNTETQIEGLNGGTRGEIRLSTECYTCYHWLPPVLQKFHGKFSKVEVNIVASATSDDIWQFSNFLLEPMSSHVASEAISGPQLLKEFCDPVGLTV